MSQHEQKHQGGTQSEKNQSVINNNQSQQCSAYSLALNIGFMIVVPILIFGIGGVLLDKYLETFPIFVLVGFFLAMSSGLIIVWRKSKEMIDNINNHTHG